MSLKRVRLETPFQLPETTKPEYLEYFQTIEKQKNQHNFPQALDWSQELIDKMTQDRDIDIEHYPLYFENPVQEILYKTNHPNYEDEAPEQPLAQAYYSLGALLIECNYINEAIKYLEKAYALAPYSPVVALEYIEGLKSIGDYEKAKQVIKETLPVTYELNHIAHFIRDLGFIAIEEEEYGNALLFYLLSLKYADSPVAEQEIDYINYKATKLDPYSEEVMQDFRELVEKEGYNLSPIIEIVQMVNDYKEKKEEESVSVDINEDFYTEIFGYMQKLNTKTEEV